MYHDARNIILQEEVYHKNREEKIRRGREAERFDSKKTPFINLEGRC